MPHDDYFTYRADDLRSSLKLSTSILQHHGETGANLEFAVKNFLKEYIPNKIGVESGFVRSLEDLEWQSPQLDILLTRKDLGHPLAVLPGSKVFPIEAVIGAMEVTKTINKKKLKEDFEKVHLLKTRVKRTYILPLTVALQFGLIKPDEKIAQMTQEKIKTSCVYKTFDSLQPRFYYFAFGSNWKNVKTICRNFKEVGKATGAHCHGMFVLGKGYFYHKPYGDFKVMYTDRMPDAFVLFLNNVIESLNSFTHIPYMASIPLSQYAKVDTSMSEW
jgi:hypothetical protein